MPHTTKRGKRRQKAKLAAASAKSAADDAAAEAKQAAQVADQMRKESDIKIEMSRIMEFVSHYKSATALTRPDLEKTIRKYFMAREKLMRPTDIAGSARLVKMFGYNPFCGELQGQDDDWEDIDYHLDVEGRNYDAFAAKELNMRI